MDLIQVSDFKRRPAALSSPSGVAELIRSAPSHSPSSPPSSQSPDSISNSFFSANSASSSVCVSNVTDQTQGTEVVKMSSTFGSLAKPFLSTPSPSITSSDSFLYTLVQPSFVDKKECRIGKMDDPFHPIGGVKVKEREGEKYDPFEPTGSPGSDADDRSGYLKGRGRNCIQGGDEKKEKKPADSTDSSTCLPSPCPPSSVPLWWKEDSGSGKTRQPRDSNDSDHSEIEEGEIVGAADRHGGNNRPATEGSPSVSFFVSKPERILRVLEGDSFVSVHTEGVWEVGEKSDDEPVVGVEDLRSKLLSRHKERYLSLPVSTPLLLQPLHSPSHPSTCTPSSCLKTVGDGSKNHKSFKGSNDCDQQKSKDRKAGDREERKKKRKKDKEGGQEKSKDRERGKRDSKKTSSRHSRSSSSTTKKTCHSSIEASQSSNSLQKRNHNGHSSSSQHEERHIERGRSKHRDRVRDKYTERDRHRGGDRNRDVERKRSCNSSHRRHVRDGQSSSQKDKERKGRKHSSSRRPGISKRSKRSREKRENRSDGQCEREKRRDGRPVVPPSIQDLNGSDLFAIKRTITVTTTTTTTAVPGSPRLALTSYCRPAQVSNKQHKRHKKRKWLSGEDMEDKGSCHSCAQSLSPPRYHSYESEHYSDKLEIDVLSLDGEALDSDYQLLEDTPPAALPPEPKIPSPQTKTTPKTVRHHQKKKSKKVTQSETSSLSSNKSKTKCLSSLTVTSGSTSISSGLTSLKQTRKIKNKDREKRCRKDLSHSGKSKKEEGSNRKGKLQSKVSVLVREGVSSTTGGSVCSGKRGMDLLGPGVAAGGTGGSVVGGSIAVVFCRDNESRSPFLKPCSEPLSLVSRNKDLASLEKRSRLAAPLPSLTSQAGRLKSKKTKPSSITSSSSSASSSSLTLATKRRRHPVKKTKIKVGVSGLTLADKSQTKASSESWDRPSLDVQSAVGDMSNSVSPHIGQAGIVPSSSSSSLSSTTIVLPPSSSPHQTLSPTTVPLRDTRESSPDSQTVDSSCKTPETSFLVDDCPMQTSPRPTATSPSSLCNSQGGGHSNTLSTPTAKPPPVEDAPKSSTSPSYLSSSTGCDLTSLPLPMPLSDPSSSVSSSSVSKPFSPLPSALTALPWSLQTGVDCTTGGVLACKFAPDFDLTNKHTFKINTLICI